MANGKVLLITGASSGIGAATARAAVDAGWRVALAARSKDKLDDLANELGDAAMAVSCDVTEEQSQDAMVAATLDCFGQIDAVFANAGHGANGSGVQGGDVENWRSMILTNVLGVAITAKASWSALKDSRGHFVVTGSMAGRKALSGSVYGATKWAVRGYAENLRQEARGTGIRVTEIAPGMVDTPFFDDEKPDALRPEDIARAVLHALSQPQRVDTAVMAVYPVPKEG